MGMESGTTPAPAVRHDLGAVLPVRARELCQEWREARGRWMARATPSQILDWFDLFGNYHLTFP